MHHRGCCTHCIPGTYLRFKPIHDNKLGHGITLDAVQIVRMWLFVCILLMADGPQRARLPLFPPTAGMLTTEFSEQVTQQGCGTRLLRASCELRSGCGNVG